MGSRTLTLRWLGASLVAGAVVALLLFQAWATLRGGELKIGVGLELDCGVRVTSVEADGPADRAGVLVGDVLLRANGEPVVDFSDLDRAQSAAPRGRPVEFVVGRGERQERLTITPGGKPHWLAFTLNTLAALGCLVLAVLVLLGSGGGLRARLLVLLFCLLAFELALTPDWWQLQLNILATAAFYVLTGGQMAVELHLASLIPRRREWLVEHRWIVPLFYVTGLTAGLLPAAAYLLESWTGAPSPVPAWWLDGLLEDWAFPFWALAVLLLLGDAALRSPTMKGRIQAALVWLGVLPWGIYILGGRLLGLMDLGYPDWVEVALPLILLCYPVAVFVAVFRYDLGEIRPMIRSGLIYGGLTTILLLVFYAAIGAGGALLSRWVDGEVGNVWLISGTTLILGLLFAPLRRALERLIDRRLLPERGNLRQGLVELAGELPSLGKLDAMGRHLVDRLRKIFGVCNASLLMADPEAELLLLLASAPEEGLESRASAWLLSKENTGIQVLSRLARPMSRAELAAASSHIAEPLDSWGAAQAVPLVAQQQLVGVLLLGDKENGLSFQAEELELLNLFAHHVATVLENFRLFESATYESLTGLLRREAVREVLDRELQRATRYQRPLTIGLADLDHFKEVNDRYGHLAGDAVLRRVAETLSSGLRASDAIGRYGGEEFLMVFPETQLTGAASVAEKIRCQLNNLQVPMEDGSQVQVRVSIGLAELQVGAPGESPDAMGLIAAADRALYGAKQGGRDRVAAAVDINGQEVLVAPLEEVGKEILSGV